MPSPETTNQVAPEVIDKNERKTIHVWHPRVMLQKKEAKEYNKPNKKPG